MNIFIEGLQGSGKSTLANRLFEKLPSYNIYREGDYNPCELAWQAYMDSESYNKYLEKYNYIAEEIKRNTFDEEDKKVVTYTRVLAETHEFYSDMEQFEMYNGRVDFEKFREIILHRYENYSGVNGIFECSLLQNSIESMMLFYEMEDDKIIHFYQEVYDILNQKGMKLVYLDNDHIRESTIQIKKERSDENGVEMWFPLMMEYLKTSPYGITHGYHDLEDMIHHFERRHELEKRIIAEVFEKDAIVLKAKEYDLDIDFEWLDYSETRIETENLILKKAKYEDKVDMRNDEAYTLKYNVKEIVSRK